MDSRLLQRVMDLAEKTGDRIIVVNPKNGTAHAVMPFDAYEKLVSNTASLRDLDESWDRFSEEDLHEAEEGLSRQQALEIDSEDSDGTDDDPQPTEKTLSLVEELNRITEEAIKADKKAKESQKDTVASTPLDILDEEENEEQYYLEPLE